MSAGAWIDSTTCVMTAGQPVWRRRRVHPCRSVQATLVDVLSVEPSTACPARPRLLGGCRRPDASDKCDQDE
jgi:hypothetical protein